MKIRNPFIIRTAARLFALATRGLFWTTKIEVRSLPDTGESYLHCLWHDSILGVLFDGRPTGLAGLASMSGDGAIAAYVMEACNIRVIRGSSNRGGAAAIREIQRTGAEYHVGITTDGPRGPRHEIKDGILFLAAKTGRPIVPVAFDMERAWRPKSKWTDLIIPKPFARGLIVEGEPIRIPPRIKRDEYDMWRGKVQQAMDDLNEQVSREMGRDATIPFVPKQKTKPKAA